MISQLTLYFGLTIIALILSVFNTLILYFRKMISPSDVKDFIYIINLILEIAGTNDDRIKEILNKLEKKYT